LTPYLPGTNTGNKEVLDTFFNLITKGAGSRVRKTMLGKAVSYPASVVHLNPNEKFAP